MDEKKYKRFEYLKHNLDYLSIRERQEYYELLSELSNQQYHSNTASQDESAKDFAQTDDKPLYRSESSTPLAKRVERNGERKASGETFKPEIVEQKAPKEKKNRFFKSAKPKLKRRWIWRVLLLLLAIFLVMIGFFIYGYQRGVKHEGGTIKTENFDGQKNSDGSINILILGADERPWQSSGVAHSDTIMVMNVNNKSHQVKLVSFMRDTLVNIPDVGSASDGPNMKINAAYTIGEQNSHQGAELMRETLQQNFGINCQYYAVVDFSSFATIIDSLFPGGVEIDAKFSTINGQTYNEVPVPDDLAQSDGVTSADQTFSTEQAAAYGYEDSPGIYEMIKAGSQKMNGRTLLNYARFRHDDQGDFGRVQRQQQVMQTIMSKVKNPLALFSMSSALGTARAVTMTNLPTSFFLTHGLGTLFNLSKGVKSYTVPSDNDWQAGYDMYGGSGLLIDMTKYKAQVQSILGQ